jgi:hypothetical protein
VRRGFLRNGLIAVVLCAPVSLIVIIKTDVWFAAYLKIPIVEPILWTLLLVWAVPALRRRERPARFVPIPVCAFLSVAWLSAVTADGFAASCKELVQYVDYFLMAYLLFLNLCDRARDTAIIRRAMCILAGTVIAYGVVQYALYYGAPHLVSSLLDDRNIMGAFLAILLPVPYGVLLFQKRLAAILPLTLMIVAGVLIMTTAVAPAVLLIALLLMHAIGRAGVGVRAGVVLGAIAVALVARVEVRSRDIVKCCV